VDRTDVTGLVLAGGRGSRMGGQDKGLQALRGRPLARHVMDRLQPQVGTLLINANRNIDAYGALGAPVVQDSEPDFSGPLAGLLAGMRASRTAWLLCAPCDAPLLPLDLLERLAAQIGDAALALPCSRDGKLQPLFTLLRCDLHSVLAAALARGERKVQAWACAQPHAIVPFDRIGDECAFLNINSSAELLALQDRE
jgi:molybdopterin-guanine dinucleotide biosynthesis protein A